MDFNFEDITGDTFKLDAEEIRTRLGDAGQVTFPFPTSHTRPGITALWPQDVAAYQELTAAREERTQQ